jgi:hypothetical protein
VEQFGSHGWLLWNPQNIYSRQGLKREGASEFAYQRSEKIIKEVILSKKPKEESRATSDLVQGEPAVSEPSQKASEPVIHQNPVTAEQQNSQEEPSPSTQSDPQEGQEVAGSIH